MSRWALNALLTVLGKRLARASETSANFRAALSRDVTIIVEAGDVVHHYVTRDRTITAGRGAPPKAAPAEASCTLKFTTTGKALRALSSRNRVNKIIANMLDQTAQVEGDIMLLLWFECRIQHVMPIGNQKRPPVRFEGAYTAPRDDIKAASWITREPAVEALSADQTAAWEQREKLSMSRAASGLRQKEF